MSSYGCWINPKMAESLTPAQRGARTKKHAYADKIKAALKALLETRHPSQISPSSICEFAAVSTDPFYKPHHASLRKAVEEDIEKALAASQQKPPKRRKNPSELEAKVKVLEAEKRILDTQLKNAQAALNLLGQMLESAVSTKAEPEVIDIHRKRKTNTP
jgi:septal ring factor EnvC (AmiA/AmiB activator)